MKRYLPIMFCIILVLASCQLKREEKQFEKDESTKYENKPNENNINATNQEYEYVLHIEIPGKPIVNISIGNIPIINEYLEQFEDKTAEVNRMQGSYLLTENEKDYILLSYSCGNKLCNQLLIEHEEGTLRSLPLSELSFLQNYKQHNNYIAFLFGKNEGSEVIRNEVVMMNLDKFEEIPPPEHLQKLSSFEYPIPIIEWDNHTLIAQVADIDDTSYQSLKEWNNNKTYQKFKWNIK